MAKAKTTELQKVHPGSVALAEGINFGADSGAGMETAGQEAFAIPFLSVLQKMSPQVDEDDPKFIKGAKPGMFIETVSGRLFDGKEGVTIIPCAYKRVFLRWTPREAGGAGFKGEVAPSDIAEMRARGEIVDLDGRLYAPSEDGAVNPKRNDRFADNRLHFCLLYDPKTGATQQVLLSITSTQIKKSKSLMSMMAAVKVDSPNGGQVTPATFANIVKVTTIPESNDKGSWHGVKFEMAGFVNRPDAYAAAKAFHHSVMKGVITARYDEDGDAHEDETAATGF